MIDIGPGIVELLTPVTVALAAWLGWRVKRELEPNGGGSVRDVLDRIESRQVQYVDRLDQIERRLSALEDGT